MVVRGGPPAQLVGGLAVHFVAVLSAPYVTAVVPHRVYVTSAVVLPVAPRGDGPLVGGAHRLIVPRMSLLPLSLVLAGRRNVGAPVTPMIQSGDGTSDFECNICVLLIM